MNLKTMKLKKPNPKAYWRAFISKVRSVKDPKPRTLQSTSSQPLVEPA